MKRAGETVTSSQREFEKAANLLAAGISVESLSPTLRMAVQGIRPGALLGMSAVNKAAMAGLSHSITAEVGPTLKALIAGVGPSVTFEAQGAMKAIMTGIGPSLAASVNPTFITAMANDLHKGLVARAMGAALEPTQITQSLRYMAQAQQAASSLVAATSLVNSAVGSFRQVELLMARNNGLIASSLENINHLGLLSNFSSEKLDSLLFRGVSKQVLGVTRSFDHLFSPEPAGSRPAVVETDGPALATSSYASSLRLSLDNEAGSGASSAAPTGDRLEDLLGRIDPALVDMRRGSWEAINGSNPDRCRHAAVSARELIRQVLERLAPDVAVDLEEPGSKIKGRVKAILGDSANSAGFLVAMSGAAFALYGFLSMPTHTGFSRDGAVRAALTMGEGLLLFFLEERVR